MSTAAAVLTRSEFVQLQAGLSLVELKAPLENGAKMFDSPKKEAASAKPW